jgi:hypothetical protein
MHSGANARTGFHLITPAPDRPHDYTCVQLPGDPAKAESTRAWLKQTYPSAEAFLRPYFYDPHAMMASVLDDLLAKGTLLWPNDEHGSGFPARSAGSCQFCVNHR